MLIATPYSLSAHERGQLGPVDYLAGPGDVWESRLKAEGAEEELAPQAWEVENGLSSRADLAVALGFIRIT